MAKGIIQKNDKWFPILTRRGAVLLGSLESAGFGDKLLEFTDLDVVQYKEIRVVKEKAYTIFLEGITWSQVEGKLSQRLKTDENYLNHIFKKFYSRISKLEEFSRLKDLTNLSDLKLSSQVLAYDDLYSDIAPFYLVYSGLRPALKGETENWLKEKVSRSKLQDYHITLTTPTKPLYAVEEDRALGEIVEIIQATKRIKELFEKSLSKVKGELPRFSSSIYQKIKRHLDTYYWVPVERDNPRWELEDIISRIQYKLKKERRAFGERQNLEQKQRLYEKELAIPPEIMVSFRGLRDLMSAVDAMKKTYAISHCFLSDLLKETARRLKIRVDILYFLTPGEISKLIKDKKQVSEAEIRSRKSCIVIGHRVRGRWKVEIIGGRQARLIVRLLTKPQVVKEEEVVKGIPASPGKVVGAIKILKDATEVDKLSQDEILVTPMTTPDYIVAIHKAAAIVTDEGGVLSHASIVSREFGIPCIIGTKIATKALKDGDLVEVDAEKGIVKKIK